MVRTVFWPSLRKTLFKGMKNVSSALMAMRTLTNAPVGSLRFLFASISRLILLVVGSRLGLMLSILPAKVFLL